MRVSHELFYNDALQWHKMAQTKGVTITLLSTESHSYCGILAHFPYYEAINQCSASRDFSPLLCHIQVFFVSRLLLVREEHASLSLNLSFEDILKATKPANSKLL